MTWEEKEWEDMMYDVDLSCSLIEFSNFNGGVVLDIGACWGAFVTEMFKYHPESVFYCFEPSDFNFKFLLKRTNSLPVIPFRGAITNGDNIVEFIENNSPQQGSIIMTDYLKDQSFSISKKYNVFGYDFQKMVNLIKPNLIKIDIEGFELFLNYDNIPESVNTIFMEVHMTDTDSQGNKLYSVIENDVEVYSKIIDNLKSQGFEFIDSGWIYPYNGNWEGTSITHLMCMTRKTI
jgi:FkbM family methyltransferase